MSCLECVQQTKESSTGLTNAWSLRALLVRINEERVVKLRDIQTDVSVLTFEGERGGRNEICYVPSQAMLFGQELFYRHNFYASNRGETNSELCKRWMNQSPRSGISVLIVGRCCTLNVWLMAARRVVDDVGTCVMEMLFEDGTNNKFGDN